MLEAYINVFYTAGICLILAKGQDGSVLQHSAPKQNSTLGAFQPQQECKMLHTNVFQLDLGCVLRRKSRTTAHALTAPSLAACKRVCCEYEEGPCDLVYYNRYHKCVVMNYHVLSLCPLMAPTVSLPGSYSFTLLLSVTERVTPSLKQHLILKGYSSQIAQFLGCDRDSFVCNNWQCIDKKYVCDDTPHCSDNSDESRCPQIIVAPRKMGCLSYHGDYVKNGEEYTPFGKADECQRCICGNDSLPSYCYSATCNNVQLTNCDNNNPDICCVCHKSTIQNNDPSDDNSDIFVNLSGTQRLIVSCMSVLVVVTLLLFFSRNLMHRARGAFMPNGGNHRGRSRNTWVPHPTHALPPTRPFMGRYFTRNSSMSFVETD
uniref:VWFC domain-containing protein n=1 Tax=Ciona savignyi TaxID=51511 RepID=H2ZEK8_CIOSA